MKKLFADPHFNVMDGLDTYIDDYGKPDPIPQSMLRQLDQSAVPRALRRRRTIGDEAAPALPAEASPDGAGPAGVAQSSRRPPRRSP